MSEKRADLSGDDTYRKIFVRIDIRLFLLSIAVSLIVLIATGLVTGWGEWYSESLALRWQTEAMMKGTVVLSQSPLGIEWDLAWNNGVHQLWGLGVPCFRLPFELIAKLLGAPAFPDRLTFGIALALTIYIVGRTHFLVVTRLKEANVSTIASPLLLVTPILFPPFLSLCFTPFLVYEEVVAYSFLAGLILIALTVSLSCKPSVSKFFLLAAASGLAVFVRPTLIFYGGASVVVATILLWRQRWPLRTLLLGWVVFVCGVGGLLASNESRFGSPLEFGHALSYNTLDSMRFASRFDYPFRATNLKEAACEMFSLLFLTRQPPDGAFLGQANTFRWRELYFSTYDITYGLIVVCLLIWLARCAQKRQSISDNSRIHVAVVPGIVVAFIASSALVGFYLRCPFISSRYLLDFGPAFAWCAWAFWILIFSWAGRASNGKAYARLALGAQLIMVLWWSYEIMTIRLAPHRSEALSRRDLITRLADNNRQLPSVELPREYTNGFNFKQIGIPFNGVGWQGDDGKTKASVGFFVESPECLILDVTTNPAAATNAYEKINAKIGLEILRREAVVETTNGVEITFHGPRKKEYQNGIQSVFLGMMSAEELSDGDSQFRLSRVRWQKETTDSR